MTAAQEARWKAEAEIIKEIGKIPSSRKMQQLLKDKYGIIVNHNIVNQDLKKDLEALTPNEYDNQKFGILEMLNKEIEIAHNIATNDPDNQVKLKAMGAVSKLSKTKAEVLTKFRKAQAEISKKEQAQINVFIGKPKEIDMEKFKKLEGDIKDEETD